MASSVEVVDCDQLNISPRISLSDDAGEATAKCMTEKIIQPREEKVEKALIWLFLDLFKGFEML